VAQPLAMTVEEQATWARLEAPPPGTSPAAVVKQANTRAQIDPTMERYDGGKRARQVYPFVDGAVYKIFVGTISETTVLFPRGERPVLGIALDPDVWDSIMGSMGGDGPTHQQVLKLRAYAPGKRVTISVPLHSGKVLYLALESVEHTGMIAVGWEWPRPLSAAGGMPEGIRTTPPGLKAPKIDLSRLHKYYQITVVKGVSPYEIVDVFDDGYLTVLRFAQPLSYTAVPTIHIRYADGSMGPVNARPYADPEHPEKGAWYILQGVYPAIELRGPDKVEVQIVRQTAPGMPVLTSEGIK
jgi:type IV secretory pathway VirB9-like protein